MYFHEYLITQLNVSRFTLSKETEKNLIIKTVSDLFYSKTTSLSGEFSKELFSVFQGNVIAISPASFLCKFLKLNERTRGTEVALLFD